MKIKKEKKQNNLVTKGFLDKRFDQYHTRLMKYLNARFAATDEKLKKLDALDERLDKIMRLLDWLVGQYKKFDQEHVVLSEQSRRMTDQLENHETRIASLEKTTFSP